MQKRCENCRHYRQHFVCFEARFHRAACGHCVRHMRKRRIEICSDWEVLSPSVQRRERVREIKEVIENMSERLLEIEQMLCACGRAERAVSLRGDGAGEKENGEEVAGSDGDGRAELFDM